MTPRNGEPTGERNKEKPCYGKGFDTNAGEASERENTIVREREDSAPSSNSPGRFLR